MRRKALEPIIAALLLVVVAVVGGIMLYMWTQKFLSSQTSATSTGPVTSARVLSIYPINGQNISIIIRSDVAPIVRTALARFANGTVYTVMQQVLSIKPLGNGIYNVTIMLRSSLLRGYSYYLEIVTANLGTIFTPTFSW